MFGKITGFHPANIEIIKNDFLQSKNYINLHPLNGGCSSVG